MKAFLAVIVAFTLAAAGPLVAAVDCGGCWGSLLCPAPPPCPAGARHVSLPAGHTTGSASVIQAAISHAASRAVICVGPGTYTGNITFAGKPVTLKASPPLGAILKGTGSGPVVTFNTHETYTSVLDGFQITGGAAPAGGGILILNASPIVQNCLIKGNSATGASYPRGGGAYVGGSFAAPSILCTCFQGNHSDYAGGGLSTNYLAHPYLNDDTFAGNEASYGGGYSAGFSGLANIENSAFSNNSAIDGAGLHVLTEFGHTLVRRTVIQGNRASSNGGGMWVPAGFATVLNAVFDGNSAANGGAAATGFDGVLTVESSILVHNATSGAGSATLAADPSPVGTTLVSNFNLFFGNGGGDSSHTSGNAGILTTDPLFDGSCYALSPTSPALHAGIPGLLFGNANSTVNNLGIRGGPVVP
jgi:hypothetical protein